MSNKSYEYATKVLAGEIVAPKQVKQACRNSLEEFDVLQKQEDYPYFWNEEIEQLIDIIIQQLET